MNKLVTAVYLITLAAYPAQAEDFISGDIGFANRAGTLIGAGVCNEVAQGARTQNEALNKSLTRLLPEIDNISSGFTHYINKQPEEAPAKKSFFYGLMEEISGNCPRYYRLPRGN
jgi:hypothetical protein